MSEETIKTLLEHSVSVNPEDVDMPGILNTAVEKGYSKFIEDLLKCVDVDNMLDSERFGGRLTPLHIAVNGRKVAKLFINYGPNVTVKNCEGTTLIVHNIQNTDTEMCQLIFSNGGDIKDHPILLCTAAKYGSLQLVRDLLKDGADIDMTDNAIHCLTPLHIAAKNNKVEVAKLLITSGANLNVKDGKGRTPIVHAIQNMNTGMIELLLTNGADVKDDPILLCTAAANGCLKLIQNLLKGGADVNRIGNSIYCLTPLHSAVINNQVEVAELLINYKANVNVQDSWNRTPIVYAIKNKNTVMIELLLTNGADVKDPIVLCTAAAHGNLKLVEDLLKDGADVNVLSNSDIRGGLTPLHRAVKRKQEKMAKLLINYEANLNVIDGEGKIPIGYAISNRDTKITKLLLSNDADINDNSNLLYNAVQNRSLKIVEDLLNYGADVNMKYDHPFIPLTFLHSAVKDNNVEMVKLLLKYKANVNIPDRCLEFPIENAIRNRNAEITKLLLANGADIQNHPYLLCVGIQYNHPEIVELLLQYGADVNPLVDPAYRVDMPPIHSAVRMDNIEVVKILLNYGADINIRNGHETPIDRAVKGNQMGMTKFLLTNGVDLTHNPYILCDGAQYGYLQLVVDLLQFGADVNAIRYSDYIGHQTALSIAVKRQHVKMTKILIEHGADVNFQDSWNQSPIVYAIRNQNTHIVQLLLSNGAEVPNLADCDLNFGHGSYKLLLLAEDLLTYGADVNTLLGPYIYGVTEIVMNHITNQMKTIGLHVNKRRLLRIRDDDHLNFVTKCEAEIELMKNERIANSDAYFYDIFAKKACHLAKNQNIVLALKSDDWKTKFPIYSCAINTVFGRGLHREELQEQIRNKILHSLFESLPKLPFLCTEKIFSNLRDNDLANVLSACKRCKK